MSFDDFCGMTPPQFDAVARSWREGQDANFRAQWERTRMLAAIMVQPYVKGKITPEKLLPFPWERRRDTEPTDAATARAVFRRAMAGSGR